MKSDTVWDKEKIQQLLSTNDRAVARAVVVIYQRQTDEERGSGKSTVSNGKGFTKFDAEFMSSIARTLLTRGSLTPKQLAITRNRVKKYWRQLVELANLTTAVQEYERMSNGE